MMIGVLDRAVAARAGGGAGLRAGERAAFAISRPYMKKMIIMAMPEALASRLETEAAI